MQAHLCAHMFQSPHQKMHGPHPGLDRAKGMLHRTAPNTHTVGHAVHAIFHASMTASCSQRLTLRSLPVVHFGFNEQPGQAEVQ